MIDLKPNRYHFKIDNCKPTFLEQWVSGTYIVTGVFPTTCHTLTLDDIAQSIPSLYSTVKLHKKSFWPRGICGYYLIPVYITSSPEQPTIEWIHVRHPYRWGVWHEPLLYNHLDNTAHMRTDYGLANSAYREYLFNIFGATFQAISQEFGFDFPNRINGLEVKTIGN